MLARSHVIEHAHHSGAISDRLEITEAMIRRACEQPTLDDAVLEILAASTILLVSEAGHA